MADQRNETPALAGGLSWSWSLDFETLLAALNEPAPWNRPAPKTPVPSPTAQAEDAAARSPSNAAGAVDAEIDPAEEGLADWLEAVESEDSRVVPLSEVAGRVAEALPTGPDLAGWLATSPAGDLEDGALAGVAAAYHRLAAWAQAGELSAIAQMASRSAAADKAIGVDEKGRPARLPSEACAQVSLALTMSHASAEWWSGLGVMLAWRLAATGAALRAGEIDLSRARLIAEATAHLDDEKARAVESRVLPGAGDKTNGQLRAALRRAVIAEDPEGAERRREEAERRARVCLYPDDEGTASLSGYNLPGVSAAAAMARVSALARAWKASGAGGGIDLLRAHVFLGLLLGTLPYIPPAADGPQDEPPDAPSGGQPDQPSGGQPDRPPEPEDPGPNEPSDDAEDYGDDRYPDDSFGPVDRDGGDLGQASRPPPAWPEVLPFVPPGPAAMGALRPVGGGRLDLRVPWTTLTGDSAEPGYLSRIGPITPAQACSLADLAATDGGAEWRVIVTNSDGIALGVARIPRGAARASPPRAGPGGQDEFGGTDLVSAAGLVGRVTVTLSVDSLGRPPPDGPPILAKVMRAATRAADCAFTQATTDAATPEGCAHIEASRAYRPSPRLAAYVIARDSTCRFRTCRQPAWRCDLDHTTPYDQGGRTCHCNLGGLCRFHHQLKQHLRWLLAQPIPGTFIWTTPTGRTYTTRPDVHAA